MPLQNKDATDALLFSQFKKGNERAFTHYFESYYAALVGFSKQFVYDEDQARGVAQEAFVNLWVNRNLVDKPAGIKSFLYTSAKSKCLNLLKHEKVVRKYQDKTLADKERNLNLEVLHALDFDSFSLLELEETIAHLIAKLPEQTQLIFKMKRIEHKKNLEIAEELSISVKTVEAHMTRALAYLRESLTDYLPAFLIALILK
ncbi:RNA polymerase sigma-70 factor [Leeuwenhoekiella sp. W20_SRS_FM14]|uniref:RNA polymerase sigma-70 factor n=1 Tax=Leeuwenhoekiella sp. W20_SRS_FM14 TaxID=3240270 RepID=UPI003F975555